MLPVKIYLQEPCSKQLFPGELKAIIFFEDWLQQKRLLVGICAMK
jgi:glucose uptake protein GlcU